MAGGSGTRFWPKSIQNKPKQLLSFTPDGETLIEKTIHRFSFVPSDQKWIVTTKRLTSSIQEVLKDPAIQYLSEPQGRNTAPCVFWAAKEIQAKDPEALMLVVPSDHWIEDESAFIKTVQSACEYASTHDDLVTLGVQPTRAETGYGYLKVGSSDSSAHPVLSFKEKPDLETAQKYLDSGDYLWNGGMFLWKVSSILNAFDQYMPELDQAWKSANEDPIKAYPDLTATSIDFGIMEKASNVMTFPLNCGWDDLGNWLSVENLYQRLGNEASGGVILDGEILALESKNNIIDVPNRLVSLIGIEDCIIVDNGKSLLIAKKDQNQKIKDIVSKLKESNPDLI